VLFENAKTQQIAVFLYIVVFGYVEIKSNTNNHSFVKKKTRKSLWSVAFQHFQAQFFSLLCSCLNCGACGIDD